MSPIGPITLTISYDGLRRGTAMIYTGAKLYEATQYNKQGKPTKYEWVERAVGYGYAYNEENNKKFEYLVMGQLTGEK